MMSRVSFRLKRFDSRTASPAPSSLLDEASFLFDKHFYVGGIIPHLYFTYLLVTYVDVEMTHCIFHL